MGPAESANLIARRNAIRAGVWVGWLAVVAVGAEIARPHGIPLLIVNAPTFIASGPNAEREYNSYYGRSFYDRYRRVLQEFCGTHAIPYLDLWNLVPPSEYSDTPGHYTPAGNARIARAVTERLSELAR